MRKKYPSDITREQFECQWRMLPDDLPKWEAQEAAIVF